MFSSPIASRLAVASTRRALTEPAPEGVARPAGPRRAIALALRGAAHRLDPSVAS
jgi:hypothetical protein